MVKDFYDSGFSESSTDDKPAMSQEELRFVCELERTVVLIVSHYEMTISLKDRKAPVPNNKPQVEHCAYWLKRKLQRNKNFHNDYKCFMADIIDKDYACKVPVDLQDANSKKWYIPHHGIYHPHKPGKIRVVLNCSAKYQGKSLYDLFGVLTRFRQKKIALTADIESMFYRVRVSEADCSYLLLVARLQLGE